MTMLIDFHNAIQAGLEDLRHSDLDCLIIQADCLSAMRHLPPECIDLTITDPAYESLGRHRAIGTTTRLTESAASSNKWFETFSNLKYWELFESLGMIHKQNTHCYVFCDSETEHVIMSGRNPYNAKLDAAMTSGIAGAPPYALFGRAWPPLTWVKTKKHVDTSAELTEASISMGMGYHWRRSTEQILFLEKGKRKLNSNSMPNVLMGSKASRSDYPTQKPYEVIRKLIQNSSTTGNIILDCFAGSGAVGHAAENYGCKSILIDLDIDGILANKDKLGSSRVIREKVWNATQDKK